MKDFTLISVESFHDYNTELQRQACGRQSSKIAFIIIYVYREFSVIKKDLMQNFMDENRYQTAPTTAPITVPPTAPPTAPSTATPTAIPTEPSPASPQPLCRHPFNSNSRQRLSQYSVCAAHVQSTSMAFWARKPEVRQSRLVKTHVLL